MGSVKVEVLHAHNRTWISGGTWRVYNENVSQVDSYFRIAWTSFHFNIVLESLVPLSSNEHEETLKSGE